MRMLPAQGKLGFGFKHPYPNKQPFISAGLVNKPHLGTDLIIPIGTPLVAPEDGVVIGEPTGPVLGHTVHFKGVSGITHILGHCSAFKVPVGAQVKCGELLALSGNSGSATEAPHLHWVTSRNGVSTNIKDLIDPLRWVAEGQEMVTKDNANGILFWLDGKADHGTDSQLLADALNSGSQTGKIIIDKYKGSNTQFVISPDTHQIDGVFYDKRK